MGKFNFGLAAAGSLSVAVLLGSCAKEQEALIVTRALIVDADCASAVGGNTFLSRGVVDVSFDTAFWASFELKNNLQAVTAAKSSTGVDASEMYLDSVDVVLETPQDPSIIAAVKAVDPALVDYNQILASSSFSGQDLMSAWVEVPQATFDALRSAISAKFADDVRLTMTMNVTFHAIRASNKGVNDFGEIDAREFTLPVELCLNCLRDCSMCGAGCEGDPTVGTGVCGGAQGGNVIPGSCADTMDP